MRAPLCIQLQESSMVPSLGAMLVPLEDQTTLQVPSCLMTDWWKSGSMNTSFHAQTLQDRKKPLKRSLTEMSTNYPHNQNEKHPLPLPTHGYISPFHTTICFLHACTPERLHAERLHTCNSDSVQGTNRRSATRHKKTYPSKNVRSAETVGKRGERWSK